jgi:hypothetical protein
MLELKEIAMVMAVQFANLFREKHKVAPSGKLHLSKNPLDVHVAWPDQPGDREHVTLDQYDERYITPAAMALIEAITNGYPDGTIYQFLKPKMNPYVNAHFKYREQLETQDVIIEVSSRNTNPPYMSEHNHMRVDVYYQILTPEEVHDIRNIN